MINFKTKGQLIENFDLSKITRFCTGGKAEYYFIPEDVNDLINLIKTNKNELKINIIGYGSNLLIKDSGLKGITIRLQHPNFSKIEKINNTTIKCGAFTSNLKISNFAAENNISGMEFLSCIPGSIAGGIPTNASCFGQELKNIFIQTEAINKTTGEIVTLINQDFDFKYRSSIIYPNLIFTNITLRGIDGEQSQILNKMKEIKQKKDASQPTYTKTAGSTFKNPSNIAAWKLIKEAGCQNLKYGGATVSSLHANFIINENKATSTDIENLIKIIQQKVYKEFKIKLELEIQILGD